jgi:hypothetical protein
MKTKAKGGVVKDIRVKPKMLPAPVEKGEPSDSKVSKLNTKNMRSIFGDNAEKILQLLDTNETDTAVQLIYKKALSSLVDLLPYAEHAVRKSKGARGVYQINSLISSMRELMVDIQSAQDRGMLGEALVDKVIRPAYSDLANAIVREYSTIATDAKNLIPEKDWPEFSTALRESRSRLADSINKQYRQVKDETTSYLQR